MKNMKDVLKWSVILLAVIGMFYLLHLPKQFRNYKNLMAEKTQYKKTLDSLNEIETRRNLMAYTLVTAYEISIYEAYYYSCIIDNFAQAYKSDWTIYGATIRIESNFNVSLKNPNSSASGIMQILEPTAELECKKLDINYKKNETIWREILNMTLGCFYISKHLHKGEAGAIKSYVGGPLYSDTSQYVKKYYQDIMKERKRLKYIYKGVLYDNYKGELKPPSILTSIYTEDTTENIPIIKDILTPKNVLKKKPKLAIVKDSNRVDSIK